MELLPVREAKKEQAKYKAQMKKETKWAEPKRKMRASASQGRAGHVGKMPLPQ
jgi:hypothetical protein